MIRQFNTVRDQALEGHPRSHDLADALARITDPDTMEKLLHLKVLLDSVGGQVFVVGVRNKYDPETGERVGSDHEGSVVHHTDGYVFHYEHIATALRNAPREPDAPKRPFDAPELPEPEEPSEEELVEAVRELSAEEVEERFRAAAEEAVGGSE